MRRVIRSLCACAIAVVVAGCGSSSSGGTTPAPLEVPNIQALLKLPVATPSVCPSNENGTTVGRTSPWEFTDISVFLKTAATTRERLALASLLSADSHVHSEYLESKHQAYQEFQRLYTCSASVSPAETPASYRITLDPGTTINQRNALVVTLLKKRGVATVTCAAAESCVAVVQAATASPTP